MRLVLSCLDQSVLSGSERLSPIFETNQEKAKRMENASAHRHIVGTAMDNSDLGVLPV
ncbi:MAG: hypothetical protein ABC612_05300 [Candidatus Methanosuratincola petrocarbonis]